jgi:hypothetical protein
VAHAAEPRTFELEGEVGGLFPNATIVSPVHVHNPQDFAITVVATRVVVSDANPSCTAANLEATPIDGDVDVSGGGTATVPVRFHMAATAPDACQGATFPLTFLATGAVAESGSGSTATGLPFTGADRWTLMLAASGAIAVFAGILLARSRRRAR